MKTQISKTLWAGTAALAVMVAIAVSAGVLDLQTAIAAAVVAEGVGVLELKALEKAMQEAFGRYDVNIKRTQDTATEALEESKKLGGTLEAKTAEMLKTLGESGNKLTAELLAVRQQVLDLAQKAGATPAGAGERSQKSLQEVITESAEFKACASRGNAKTMDPVMVGNLHRYAAKTQIINATGQNQPLVPDQRVPGIITPPEQRLYIRELIPQMRTASNLIQYTLESSFTNNARPQGDASPGGIEGEEFAESGLTFTLANAPVVTLGHWIPASRQVLSDADLLAGHIGVRLVYGLKLEEEREILVGTGAAGNINGICNQAAAYSRGVTNDTILDTLLKAQLQVSLSNYEASGYVLHPVDWFTAMLLKDTQGRYLFTNPQDMVSPRLWAKPVVPSQTMTQGKFLCGAFMLGATIWDRDDATVRVSENVDDHFIRNMVAILAEERLALTVHRTTAFVYGNVSHAG